VRKDLLLYFRNRRAVIMSIAAQILMAAFFGSLFDGTERKPVNVSIAVADLDRSELSLRIVAALRGDSALAVTDVSAGEATAQVRAGKQRAAIVLPAGFGAQASNAPFGPGEKPVVTLLVDPSQAMVLPLVRGLLWQHALQQTVKAFSGGTAPVAMPFATRELEAGLRPDVRQNNYAHSFAGMGAQFILMMGVDMAVGLLLTRRLGLWKRLRAAPLSRRTLLASHVTSSALIALIIFALVHAEAIGVFGVRTAGSVPGFVPVVATLALPTASFGLLVAALGRTPEATRGLAILGTLLLVMRGGAWVPAFVSPQCLQTISSVVPTRWAVDGLDAMSWHGQPFAAALMPVTVMLGFTASFFAIVLARFRWDE
jgi:ABC-2 type transport system permease protein